MAAFNPIYDLLMHTMTSISPSVLVPNALFSIAPFFLFMVNRRTEQRPFYRGFALTSVLQKNQYRQRWSSDVDYRVQYSSHCRIFITKDFSLPFVSVTNCHPARIIRDEPPPLYDPFWRLPPPRLQQNDLRQSFWSVLLGSGLDCALL